MFVLQLDWSWVVWRVNRQVDACVEGQVQKKAPVCAVLVRDG